MGKYKMYRLRIPTELQEKIKAAASIKGETIAEYYRRTLEKSVAEEMANESMDVLLPLVRKTVKDTLKPMEERWAKINAKTAIQLGTVYYLLLQVLEMAKVDTKEARMEARKKSVVDLKTDLYEFIDD